MPLQTLPVKLAIILCRTDRVNFIYNLTYRTIRFIEVEMGTVA